MLFYIQLITRSCQLNSFCINGDNYEFNSASSSKDYLFVCCAQVKQKPYLKAPDDDLDPGTAAKIAWEIHKKRNESVMVELFDVRLSVLIFLLIKSGSIKTIIDDFLVQL